MKVPALTLALSALVGCAPAGNVAPGDGGARASSVPSSTGSGSCGAAGQPGNSLGVGKSCTKGGNECKNNSSATICTVDVEPTAPAFCTTPCSTDADCGAGASCLSASLGKGCAPTACSSLGLGGASDGGASAAADAGTVSAGCGKAGDPGNSLGVGQYCQADSDCSKNSFAKFCTAAHQAGAPPFCTSICQTDADCGTGASCTSSMGLKGCVPNACQAQQTDGGATNGGTDNCSLLKTCCAKPSFPAGVVGSCTMLAGQGGSTCDSTLGLYRLLGWCS
jgi:hypothetical protein